MENITSGIKDTAATMSQRISSVCSCGSKPTSMSLGTNDADAARIQGIMFFVSRFSHDFIIYVRFPVFIAVLTQTINSVIPD